MIMTNNRVHTMMAKTQLLAQGGSPFHAIKNVLRGIHNYEARQDRESNENDPFVIMLKR